MCTELFFQKKNAFLNKYLASGISIFTVNVSSGVLALHCLQYTFLPLGTNWAFYFKATQLLAYS